MLSSETSDSGVDHCTGSSQRSDTPSRTSQGSKPLSHKGVIPVDSTFQATDNSGNEQRVVRLHKAGKLINTTATDFGSHNESSQSDTGLEKCGVAIKGC